jgi:Protein of unknown function (DUF3551)
MRSTLTLFFIAAGMLGATQVARAQSAHSYPWCAVYQTKESGGTRSCYFASYEQCMVTYSDHSAICVPSPYYHGQAAVAAVPAVRPRHHRRHRD